MKVSIITSIPWLDSSRSHEEVYREAVEQVRLADDLGFDCAWFTEHHFGTGINGAVLPFAASIRLFKNREPSNHETSRRRR